MKYQLLGLLALISACSTESNTPSANRPNPVHVPGANGGALVSCIRNADAAPVYRCDISSGDNGEPIVVDESHAIYDGHPEFDPSDPTIYAAWDGKRVLLRDSRTLRNVEGTYPGYERIDFEGVKFKFNPWAFGKMKSEVVPAHRFVPEEKPDSVAPRHVTFTFELRKRYNEAHVTVYPVKEFIEIMAADKEEQRRTRQRFDDLRRVLQNKDLRIDDEIPFIPFREGGQEILAKVKLAEFQDGKGIFFVTHWAFEAGLISNELLYYVFEGLTDDGRYYVVAEMPTYAPFLPMTSRDEFEGFTIQDLYDSYKNPENKGKSHNALRSSITGRLDAMEVTDYSPSLHHLEELISSLEIKK